MAKLPLLLVVLSDLFPGCQGMKPDRPTSVPEAAGRLWVARDGSDAWSGRLAAPNRARTDGPLATIQAARDAIRRIRAKSGEMAEATVLLRGGVYRMEEPFVLLPQDSTTTYAAYTGEKPILSGGRVIRGWKPAEGKLWAAEIPEAAQGKWAFQQLFVDGGRRTRARSPNDGYFTVAGKAPPAVDPKTGKEAPRDKTAFVYRPGDIKPWPDLADIQVVVYHSWETSRHRIAKVDEASHVVEFTGPACWAFENWGQDQRYFVENVREALDAPGEWFLDRKAGVLLYWPLPGEDMRTAEVVAPKLTRLVELKGEPKLGLWVEGITFKGLAFCHEDWQLAPEGHSDPQAVVSEPAAIMADGALDCAIEDCEIAHVGHHALWFRHACKGNRIVRNRIHDLGIGGVRIGEANRPPSEELTSSGNLIDNNHIFDGGHVYPGGAGIWVAQSHHNTLSHNEIHSFHHVGLSIGWNWDDAPNSTHHNVIEQNHVHHIMNRQLNDGGAIYTLGTSPGSIIRGNRFHDVWPYNAIGWGVYLDATTNGYLVEDNVVYNILSGGLMKHNGGHENAIRNNLFAFSAEQMLWPCWDPKPNVFERNIVYFTQGDLFIPMAEGRLKARLKAKEPLGVWDRNVYWKTNGSAGASPSQGGSAGASPSQGGSAGASPSQGGSAGASPSQGGSAGASPSQDGSAGASPSQGGSAGASPSRGQPDLLFFRHTFAEWQAMGLDKDSVIADPLFENPAAYDFRLKPDSPALKLGFQPIDTSKIGLYGDPVWVAEARAVSYPPTVFPPPAPPPKPTPIDDNFETTNVGAKPNGAVVSGEEKGASIRVSDEAAASGRRSLKFTDVPGLQHAWQPHMYYQPHFTEGKLRQSFKILLRPKALVMAEWRDETGYPECIGPSLTFDGTGKVDASGKPLGTVPIDKWVQVEVECALQQKATPGTYSVTLSIPGEPPRRFGAIPYTGTDFHELHWLGFTSNATTDAVFFIDDLKLRPLIP